MLKLRLRLLQKNFRDVAYLKKIDFAGALEYETQLMNYALQALARIPHLEIIGHPSVRIGAIPFKLHGVDDATLGEYLDKRGIALRIGHHCAQPTVAFFGYQTIARPGLAFYNTRDEIDILASTLSDLR